MFKQHSPAFTYWLTVYSGPCLVPIFLLLCYHLLVRSELEAALGEQGSFVSVRITMALVLTFAMMIVSAQLGAYWHACTGRPVLPDRDSRTGT
jgi:hypothetical protein